MMWSNLKYLEDNNCGEVFIVLNNYLENLVSIHTELKLEIDKQKIKVRKINLLLDKGEDLSIDDLILSNDYSLKLLRQYKLVKYKLLEVNGVMNKYILDYKQSALKFFNRVLNYYIEKEEYINCKIIQNVINLLS